MEGKKIASDLIEKMRLKVALFKGRKPKLAVILVGTHTPSEIYVNHKIKACQKAGILSERLSIEDNIKEDALIAIVEALNQDNSVDGILVQLPLPHHINPMTITKTIDPKKDVDGLHPTNFGKLLLGQTDGFIPCTPLGIQELMRHYEIEGTGKHALVVGRSSIVGKPMAALLMQSTPTGNATVTIAHRHTQGLPEICQKADIIVAAVGIPNFITADMVKSGAIIFDVGINRITDSTKVSGYRIVGDVDFEKVNPKCSMITPVPGGVGPMTIAMLLQNTLKSYSQHLHS